VGLFVTGYSLDETLPFPFSEMFEDYDEYDPASVSKVIALLRSSFKKLKNLSCFGVSLDESHILALPPTFTRLRHLETEKVCNSKIGEDLIAHIARRSPNLKLVRITGTQFPSSDEYIKLLPELLYDVWCAR